MNLFWRSFLCQAKAASAAMLLTFVQGMAIGWTSPAVEKLSSGEAPFDPTEDEISWIVSLYDLGLMVGCWMSTAVFMKAGRRYTVLVGPTVHIVWVLLTVFGTVPWCVMLGRLFSGCGMGIVLTFAFVYVAEVASANLRGALVVITTLMLPGGELLAFICGPYVSFKVQAILPVPFIALTFLLIFTWMQESPFYLTMVGQTDAAVKSLRAVRAGATELDLQTEYNKIRDAVEKQMREASKWKEAFDPPGTKKGACLVLVVSGSMAVVGITAILSYTTQILKASDAPIDSELASILVIALQLIMTAAAIPLIERLGRKLQYAVTSLGAAASMVGLAVFFLLQQGYGMDVSSVTWLPLAMLLLYVSFMGLGVNTVPQVLMSEILSQRTKAIMSPIVMTVVSLTSFGINKSMLSLGENPGYYVPFAFFACTNLFIGLFAIFVIPETKGKSLGQVQELLSGSPVKSEILS